MTLAELKKSVDNINKGLSYKIYKQAYLIGLAFSGSGNFPENPEKANPELYPPKKTYEMSDWIKERYYKQEGVIMSE